MPTLGTLWAPSGHPLTRTTLVVHGLGRAFLSLSVCLALVQRSLRGATLCHLWSHPLGTLWPPSGHPLALVQRSLRGAVVTFRPGPCDSDGMALVTGRCFPLTGMKSTDAFLREYVTRRRSNPAHGTRQYTCRVRVGTWCLQGRVPVGCPLEPATHRSADRLLPCS